MAQYSPVQAVSRAKYQADHQQAIWRNRCLGFVVWCYFGGPTAHGYATAAITYYHTRFRHWGTDAPSGTLVWWTGGLRGAGHVAIACGGGYCYSTDFGPRGYIGDGRVRKVPITSISRYDRNLTYRGWTRDINGITVIH
jgi:hypothetical protein